MAPKPNKTVPTQVSVDDFFATLSPQQQADGRQCLALMQKATGEPPVMWGPSIIGFGDYHYAYDSGREGDAAAAGFSPRKSNLVIYLPDGVSRHEALLQQLGPHTTGKGCLYIKRLSAIDADILRQIIEASYLYVSTQHPMNRAE